MKLQNFLLRIFILLIEYFITLSSGKEFVNQTNVQLIEIMWNLVFYDGIFLNVGLVGSILKTVNCKELYDVLRSGLDHLLNLTR